jgi:hypothetical protein
LGARDWLRRKRRDAPNFERGEGRHLQFAKLMPKITRDHLTNWLASYKNKTVRGRAWWNKRYGCTSDIELAARLEEIARLLDE